MQSPECFEDVAAIEEAMIARDFAAERWAEVREAILPAGIRPAGEDCRDLPVCLRRLGGSQIDEVATCP